MASSVQNANLPAMENQAPAPLAFVFHGNEMIIQCTANIDDQAAAVRYLEPVMRNYQNFNDGKATAIVRCAESTKYWITSIAYAETLDNDSYTIIKTSVDSPENPPVDAEPVKLPKVSKVHIRRPRNQFIIYRQWMSARIHAETPGVTAGCVSQLVAQMWRHEDPAVKARFKALADEEDRMHKLMYPGYRYVAGRRRPQLALSKRNLPHDPMTVAERLIAAGF
ncbi:uncharacterized protein THITE_2111506 [Thermothielavioides terrestris NRRL 8126]|uniref:HMG box domain-containing protein n=1 Tax=Thermothielavioides terrestris (strain ATCC 38088 / NRRL 8126) TaxID=578455 RepID=G2R2Q3_THETT|nr:uncharacterized protein THITE_2111506 [Thermothielavioides terrestris NRRL 8126]AEO65014.1 hypothetical protein THITE_2111506 [Thermothielavioides terrestris NRRL 8126]